MTKFYKYQNGEIEQYYKNLTKLCKAEELNYTNVYHSIKRLKKDVWNNDTVSVSVLFFSGV